jgi:hypothetical protein
MSITVTRLGPTVGVEMSGLSGMHRTTVAGEDEIR